MSPTEPSRPETALAAKRSWTDLGPRFVSAIVLLALTVGGLYLGGYVFAALVGAVFAGCYREWERMVTLKPLSTVGGVLIGMLALSALVYPWLGWWASCAIVAVACMIALVTDRSVAVWRGGGLIYFGTCSVAAVALRGTTALGALASLFLGVTVWLTDTGAFFTGRQIGGEKLAPDISPGKIWSGAIGGLALGTLGGLVAWLVIVPASPWWIGLLFAAAISVLGQVGDLSESFIKRRFRIKDSGDIIPGHGGLMDRLDSLTFGLLLVFVIGLARGGIDGIAGGFLHW